jgi:hypothetical protein
LACDLILAAESARFGLVERVIGLTPAMGGTQRLAERAGSGRAREFVMTGATYTVSERTASWRSWLSNSSPVTRATRCHRPGSGQSTVPRPLRDAEMSRQRVASARALPC